MADPYDLPTARITKGHLDTMTDCTGPEWTGLCAPTGWSVWLDRDQKRLIVVHVPEEERDRHLGPKAFYPVVIVVAPTRKISMAEYFSHGLQWTEDELAALRGGPSRLYFDEERCRVGIQQLKDYEVFR